MRTATHGIVASSRVLAGSYDADAQAFFTATGITDGTQKSAVNQLVLDLKGYSIWSKMQAIYPMVGGTATAHKFNLKNPLDTDAAFRLIFSGGWTHTSNGAVPNATNAYADTFLVPSAVQALNSNGAGYYSGSNLAETKPDPINFGAQNIGTQGLSISKNNTTLAARANSTLLTYTTSVMTGLFSVQKTSSTVSKLYENSTVRATVSGGGTLTTHKLYIGVFNLNGSIYNDSYVKNDFRFVYVSEGLSDTEIADLYTAVQAMQTTLSRNV